jgi:hypothetical protein
MTTYGEKTGAVHDPRKPSEGPSEGMRLPDVDDLFEERALFEQRAHAMRDTFDLDVRGVFLAMDRVETSKPRGAAALLWVAAAMCLAVAFVGVRAAAGSAGTEADVGAFVAATDDGDEPMSRSAAACFAMDTSRGACVAEPQTRVASNARMNARTNANTSKVNPEICESNVTY